MSGRKFKKKKIVVSAINFSEGGPLAILNDCLSYLSENLSHSYDIIALVYHKDLLNIPNIDFIEFPKSKGSYFNRLFYEYYWFQLVSRKISPYLWLSLHDISPVVYAENQAVYCHNATAFYKSCYAEFKLQPKIVMFSLFYKWLYRINIHSNKYIIVQQSWIKEKFTAIFKINPLKIIVANPAGSKDNNVIHEMKPSKQKEDTGLFTFIYPAFPRVFKNFEIICQAAKYLVSTGISNFEIILTIDGSENKYSSGILSKYGTIKQLKFIGIQSSEQIFKLYENVDCMIFPSKLETWGLPISEFKQYEKPMFLADLPYAHETISEYNKVSFFGVDDYLQLASLMKSFIGGSIKYDCSMNVKIEQPYSKNWKELFEILLNDQYE